MRPAVCLLTLLLGSNLVSAQSSEPRAFINGYELLRLCESASNSGFSRATDCLGYISGLSDMHEAFTTLELVPKQWCWPPEGISNRKMAAVVFEYLKANATVLDNSAALLGSLALYAAYPCE